MKIEDVFLPQKLATVGVPFIINGKLKNTTEMQRKPAQCKD